MEKQVSGEFRKELKFVLPINQKIIILNQLNSLGYTIQFPARIVNSIYFDTPLDDFLENSMNGISKRKKIRIRWYDNQSNTTLEQKIKIDNLNFKIQTPLNEFDSSDMTNNFKNAIKCLLPNDILFPVSYVSYYRIYLFNKKEGIRITLDENIFTKDFISGIKRKMNLKMILEVKFSNSNKNTHLAFGQINRFSKYCFSRIGEI